MVVYLIGAGPGDPELITLKALKVIKKADVIIYDRLINNKILEYAPEDAKLIYVGKKPGGHSKTQEEINKIIVEEAKKENIVVRLKGGDPFIFGRGGEELLTLKSHGIKTKTIPGITSAIGVPTAASLPITHRGLATSFTIVTGHEDPTKGKKQVHWDYKADTIIILMGVGNLKENTQEIMRYRPADTPVCAIENGTTEKEKITFGTLEDIHTKNIKPPAIIIIGHIVNLYKKIIKEDP
ncbi:uroporphyrinogen-III C-methyltransferase [Methanothermobacter tenebrarum]|uniref:uroporphyrinogen-III C-methyltransferase n=1 Tax=Methanothermobacter tenebrarum TaxID=680118 RepID=A0A328PBZ4_9EURY|nr:uroporphyrinogen-III C-methyltransferase [Methanothermobacter tenebrarum]MBC7101459.1 uroporphyrinogen-III C-methyltransferase [Methanobacteriales archaeon]MBC7117938.1 uroporphyrinogen-III C-methyltransferase [Methanobacteriaceae archaeon]NPV64586.1 uroporphyrinogen-III C-methyltransferase [Methanobacteriaceae archaeon]RAO78683.1 uroporphyrinogen-III C-methyltransferase [Methanothermobacter tenebrarum]